MGDIKPGGGPRGAAAAAASDEEGIVFRESTLADDKPASPGMEFDVREEEEAGTVPP